MLRTILHGLLHLAIPGLVARFAWRKDWLRAWLVMAAMNVVDLDHLLADPVYDPNRCSIGYHPLHSWPAQAVWIGLACWPRTRLIGVGALLHMALDAVDCTFMH